MNLKKVCGAGSDQGCDGGHAVDFHLPRPNKYPPDYLLRHHRLFGIDIWLPEQKYLFVSVSVVLEILLSATKTLFMPGGFVFNDEDVRTGVWCVYGEWFQLRQARLPQNSPRRWQNWRRNWRGRGEVPSHRDQRQQRLIFSCKVQYHYDEIKWMIMSVTVSWVLSGGTCWISKWWSCLWSLIFPDDDVMFVTSLIFYFEIRFPDSSSQVLCKEHLAFKVLVPFAKWKHYLLVTFSQVTANLDFQYRPIDITEQLIQ